MKKDKEAHSNGRFAAAIFIQMLPATLVVPSIRPFFASAHGGNESAMHMFMSVNMLGAIIAVPLVAMFIDRRGYARNTFRLLVMLDAALFVAMTLVSSTTLVLGLRFLEGMAHVGAASILLAEASGRSKTGGLTRTMGAAGAAIIGAVVLGSASGGALAELDPRAAFWVGAACAVIAYMAATMVCPGAARERLPRGERASRAPGWSMLLSRRDLRVPVSAAFMGRFAVGCLIVSFALFAHKSHNLGDSEVGMLYSILTIPFAIFMYPSARLTDRIPAAALMTIGAAVFGACMFVLGKVGSGSLPFLMLAMGAASALIFASTLCYGAKFSGESDRTRVMALINVSGCLGMLIGPIVGGVVSATMRSPSDPGAGYRAVFAIAALSMAAWLALSGRWLLQRLATELDEIRDSRAFRRAAKAAAQTSGPS